MSQYIVVYEFHIVILPKSFNKASYGTEKHDILPKIGSFVYTWSFVSVSITKE